MAAEKISVNFCKALFEVYVRCSSSYPIFAMAQYPPSQIDEEILIKHCAWNSDKNQCPFKETFKKFPNGDEFYERE
jgi:hypothetical protein